MITLDFSKAIIDPGIDEAKLAEGLALLDSAGVNVKYGGLVLVAPPGAIEQCRVYVAELDDGERVVIKRNVKRDLDKFIVKAEKKRKQGKSPSKTDSDNFFHDMCLWYALTQDLATMTTVGTA